MSGAGETELQLQRRRYDCHINFFAYYILKDVFLVFPVNLMVSWCYLHGYFSISHCITPLQIVAVFS